MRKSIPGALLGAVLSLALVGRARADEAEKPRACVAKSS
jgi:hypothetical protein